MLRKTTIISFSIFVAIAAGWLIFLLTVSHAIDFSSGGYRVSVLLPNVSNLQQGARVTAAGVQVGTVRSVDRQGLGARADLAITDKGVTPLPKDTKVRLRQDTPIGEHYLTLSPGHSRQTLASGGTLGLSHTKQYVAIDQVLSVLRGRSRARARQTIQGMGRAVTGRGVMLNHLVGNVNHVAVAGGKLVKVAYRDRQDAASLVQKLGDVASEVGARGAAIHTIARRGLTALGALRERDHALSQSLRQLPATLDSVRNVVSTIGGVSPRIRPVADNLAAAVHQLRPAVRALPPATHEGRRVLSDLNPTAPILRHTLSDATALSKVLPPALPELHKALCQVDPMAKYLAPYRNEAIGIIVGLSSSSNSYDATGHLIRLTPVVGDQSIGGLPDPILRAASNLLHTGLLGKIVGGLNYNPYPKVGALGHASAHGNFPIGPSEVPKTGYTYPRIKSEC
jgi:virulence factor Mce-like protein